MAVTLDPNQVRQILKLSNSLDIDVYLKTAESIVNELLENCAAGQWDTAKSIMIGHWLAAHFYALVHPGDYVVTSKSVNGASKSYGRNSPGDGFMATPFGRMRS